jgi:RNA polymerase sigma factor (sigma-70 family)
MGRASSKKHVEKQFDSFCKTLLKNEKIDYGRARSYRRRHEISFSELTDEQKNQLIMMDEYLAESEMFRVLNYDIVVKDALIGEALKHLPEKKRNVILLSFFLDMTDTEIASHMNMVRSTIHHHRINSLKLLKQIMERIKDGENK